MDSSITLERLAGHLQLAYCGNSNLSIERPDDLSSVEDSYPANRIIFYEKPPVKKKIGIESSAFLLPDSFSSEASAQGISALLAPQDSMREAFARLLNFFKPPIVTDFLPSDNPKYALARVDARAEIAEDAVILPGAVVMAYARIASGCVIHANAVISNHVVIKQNTIVYPNATIYHYCQIGEHNIIHSSAVIGADGFGFSDLPTGKRIKIPQIGNVILSDFVEVGASSTIDRATIGSTLVGAYTKIDNQVQIGHNCKVGKYVYIAGNVGIAGSVTIEDAVVLAGNVGVADHVKIAAKTIVLGMSGIPSDLENESGKKIYFGIPVRPVTEMHRINNALGKLPELLRRTKKIESRLDNGQQTQQ